MQKYLTIILNNDIECILLHITINNKNFENLLIPENTKYNMRRARRIQLPLITKNLSEIDELPLIYKQDYCKKTFLPETAETITVRFLFSRPEEI